MPVAMLSDGITGPDLADVRASFNIKLNGSFA